MTTTRKWTRAELLQLPDDGKRYEALDGQLLITLLPSALHQLALGRLFAELAAYCHHHALGVAITPGFVTYDDSELQPDIAVYFDSSMPSDVDWDDLPRASLVVEVKSAITRLKDVGVKREAYLRWGIPEYWVVDTERQTIKVARHNCHDVLIDDTLSWQPHPDMPALEIEVASLFR